MEEEMIPCPECDGNGCIEDECEECNGGYDPPLDENGEEGNCDECQGSGVIEDYCPLCNGEGEIPES